MKLDSRKPKAAGAVAEPGSPTRPAAVRAAIQARPDGADWAAVQADDYRVKLGHGGRQGPRGQAAHSRRDLPRCRLSGSRDPVQLPIWKVSE